MGHHHSGPSKIVDNDNVHIGGNYSGGISNFNNISATKKLMLQNLVTTVEKFDNKKGGTVDIDNDKIKVNDIVNHGTINLDDGLMLMNLEYMHHIPHHYQHLMNLETTVEKFTNDKGGTLDIDNDKIKVNDIVNHGTINLEDGLLIML